LPNASGPLMPSRASKAANTPLRAPLGPAQPFQSDSVPQRTL